MQYENLKKFLINEFEGKRLDEKTIRKKTNNNNNDYNKYCQVVDKLVEDNIIKPIKSSGPNGLIPVLYKRYQVNKIDRKLEQYTDQIRQLHNIFNIEEYLKKPERYANNIELINILDDFLKTKNYLLDVPASINERSFQIFGKEKVLKEDSDVGNMINYNPNLKEYLNFYYTPEPFFQYDIMNVSNMDKDINILIVENKDTWYTLQKLMNKEINSIYDIPFNKVIYGEGKKISRKKDSLTDYSNLSYENQNIKYYYYGDLDFEGIGIFKDLIDANPTLDIAPMKGLYLDMFAASKKYKLPKTKDNQRYSEGEKFFTWFSKLEVLEMKNILERGLYIPQEILGYGSLENILMNARK